MTVNKNDSVAVSAGVNAYLKTMSFSGNYALRFDMMLIRNDSGSAQSQVEMAVFGINHAGNKTNWFRNPVLGTGSVPSGPAYESDGLFFDVGADGNGSGGAQDDFGAWSAPT